MFSLDGTAFVHIWLPPNLNSAVMKPLAFGSSHPGRISFHWAVVITTLQPNGKPLKWKPPFLLHGHALFIHFPLESCNQAENLLVISNVVRVSGLDGKNWGFRSASCDPDLLLERHKNSIMEKMFSQIKNQNHEEILLKTRSGYICKKVDILKNFNKQTELYN